MSLPPPPPDLEKGLPPAPLPANFALGYEDFEHAKEMTRQRVFTDTAFAEVFENFSQIAGKSPSFFTNTCRAVSSDTLYTRRWPREYGTRQAVLTAPNATSSLT